MLSIRSARLNRGWTLADLARAAGVSVPSVRQAEERDLAGSITLANRARYLAAMGLSDAIATVNLPSSEVEALWDDTMSGAAEVAQNMAFERQPVSSVDMEQIAIRSFAKRVGQRA
ncbi:MAG: helix-turn-helix transcriptional regulator [Actinomyces urogenitalis]|uniref:helix-turn-helix domain-containing protein n=1 Tax=Actinomyces urogenitalis TaxID=103621 RepID=UPI00291532CA|nr:helix-turn-helix transcriptional regulator [Actinomyces urogenitalis]MDU6150926.1 helix-turn-helix transcriptional regulator [Actinomyces urogenitalis]